MSIERLLEHLEIIRIEARPLVEARWAEFEELRQRGSEDDLYSELCFCILTANWSAHGGMRAQKLIGHGFSTLSLEELTEKLRAVGHRYPEARAKYIVENRWLLGNLKEVIAQPDPREFIVKNVKGLGWKESSHFLRNVAFADYAILDKHVLRTMHQHGLIDEIPKGWTRKKYLDYEKRLRKVADVFGESLGKFDLYLWYMIKKRVDK